MLFNLDLYEYLPLHSEHGVGCFVLVSVGDFRIRLIVSSLPTGGGWSRSECVFCRTGARVCRNECVEGVDVELDVTLQNNRHIMIVTQNK